MKRILVIVVVLVFALSGCSLLKQETATKENVDLFYALKGNVGLDKEDTDITYKNEDEKYLNTLQEWVKGPQDTAKFEQSLQAGVKVLAVSKEQDKLTVNLSKEFGFFNGSMHEAATIAALVDTMVQFPEVNSVRITVEGADLIAPSGNPYGYLSEIKFNPNETGNLNNREVTLYFADSQAMYVVAEKRTINIGENASKDILIKALIEELIKGPQTEGLWATIPAEARVNSVTVAGERVTIDFSEEMLTKHSRGAAGEDMTLTSIGNTVTEVEGIREAVLTVNGKPLNIEHAVIDSNNPVVRMEEKILKQ